MEEFAYNDGIVETDGIDPFRIRGYANQTCTEAIERWWKVNRTGA